MKIRLMPATTTTKTTKTTITATQQPPLKHSTKNIVAPWLNLPSSSSSSIPQNPLISAWRNFLRTWPSSSSSLFSSPFYNRSPYQLTSNTSVQPKNTSSTHSLSSTTPVWPSRLDSVAVIGIHGWSPIKVVQRVVGEPTGTSQKLCVHMGAALKMFINTHYSGSDYPESAITLIPLECYGLIVNRVDHFYNQITNSANAAKGEHMWQAKIEHAKTIFLVAHSQGAPTAVLLAEKLVQSGIINLSTQSLVILSQAGIFHGPMPHNADSMYVRYVETDATRELFEFNRHESVLSERVRNAATYLLERGTKLTLVSSWLDQVVPMYSSTFHALSHQNVYRAVFIDAVNCHKDDFLAKLVTFALAVRNQGFHDNELVVHLSDVVAGSLYYGTAGHSTLYEDLDVFLLAIHHLFHNPSANNKSWSWIIPRSWWTSRPNNYGTPQFALFSAPSRLNPYHLPLLMHELFHNEKLRNHPVLGNDLDALFKLFVNWNVTDCKVRQQLKYRLQPLLKVKEVAKL